MTSDTRALAIGGQLFLVDVDDDGGLAICRLPAFFDVDDDGVTLASIGKL